MMRAPSIRTAACAGVVVTFAALHVRAEPIPLAADGLPTVGIAYRIEASLDPATRLIHGRQEIRWRNPGTAPVERLPVHLYLNAFAHERTTFFRAGFLRGGDLDDLIDVWRDPFGHIEISRVEERSESGPRAVPVSPIRPDDGNPFDTSLVELSLPAPVAPGAELILDVTFEARLPIPIARSGGDRDFFFVAQWFPKIAAFHEGRFAPHQYRGPTEFFADFADWDVTVEVPADFLVAATGTGGPLDEKGAASDRRRHRYSQRAVTDFAFACGAHLVEESHPHRPAGHPQGAPPVEIRYVTPAGTSHQIARWRRAAEVALDVLTTRVGPYPYRRLTIVSPPAFAAETAGMEYQTLVTGSIGDPLVDRAPGFLVSESAVAHEIAHNWFQGLLASNEQEEAFLDEGFTQFWETEIMEALAAPGPSGGAIFGRAVDLAEADRLQVARTGDKIREPVRKRPAGYFYPGSESSQVYSRPALVLRTAKRLFGQPVLDAFFRAYYSRARFDHPDLHTVLDVAAQIDVPGASPLPPGAVSPLARFLDENFRRERPPDYSAAALDVTPFEPPRGRVPTLDGGVINVRSDEDQESLPRAGLDPAAFETDGRVLMEILDPGHDRPGADRSEGIVRRESIVPVRGEPKPGATSWKESRVRIDGPGWDHLPVEIEFRFSDGVVLRDRWDGRAAWRAYRFLRGASLDEVRVDPEGKLAVDPRPENNIIARKADRRFAAGWATYVAAVLTALEGGLALWL